MKKLISLILCLVMIFPLLKGQGKDIIKSGAEPVLVAGGFEFTEGVSSDAQGNVYFSDIPASKIHFCTIDDELSLFLENSKRANGLQVDKKGNIMACQGGEGGNLISISKKGSIKVLADEYKGKPFNSLNDLWQDPKGGIYLTDPRYGNNRDLNQDGEHVYYLKPDGKEVIRVVEDMVRPNGVIGTPDGAILYVADHGGSKTYRYKVEPDGSLTAKELFASQGSDGLTLDSDGNVYLTSDAVYVYNPSGELIKTIKLPERPTNVCFAGKESKTLYINTPKSVYKLSMNVKGVGSN